MNEVKPSRLIFHFLRWFCPDHLYEEIEGDLIQKFNRDAKAFGKKKAKRRLVWNAIRFFRPEIVLRNKFSTKHNDWYMIVNLLRNYLLISLRSIAKHKIISFINIFGLAISMSIGLIILVIIKGQFSYDGFHPNPERTFRVYTEVLDKNGDHTEYAPSPLPLGKALMDNYPFVQSVVRVYPALNSDVVAGNTKIPLRGAFADSAFFQVFGFQQTVGDGKSLSLANSIVLKEETANKLFGNENPLQQIIRVGELGDFVITDLIKATDHKSHLDFDFYVSMSAVPSLEASDKLKRAMDQWSGYLNGYTYVVLKPEVSQLTFDNALSSLSDEVSNSIVFSGNEKSLRFKTQLLNDVAPSSLWMEPGMMMSWQTLLSLSFIGLIILILAAVNYTNLTVGRSFNRLKEVGVRRTTGAKRSHIMTQLIVESLVYSLIALVFAFPIAVLLPLNNSFQQYVNFQAIDFTSVGWFLLLTFGVGLLAGFFPALIVSKINPLQALRSSAGAKLLKTVALRKVLIVTQFSVSFIFIMVLLVMYKQSQFQVDADYGFTRDNIITVPLEKSEFIPFQNELKRRSSIEKISACSQTFHFGNDVKVRMGDVDSLFMEYYAADEQFLPLLEIPLVSGNNFSEPSPGAEKYVLINEQAVEVLNFKTPQEAIGELIILNDTISAQIAGVFRDYHNHSFKHVIMPMMLRYKPDEFREINIKYLPDNINKAVEDINTCWNKVVPDRNFELDFFDESFSKHQSHLEDVAMIGSLAMIAISISCLGLLGVVIYAMETRVKEIGIRKVFGASVMNLVVQLSFSFLILVVLAGVIAAPAGYWIGSAIMKQFVYKAEIGIGLFAFGFGSMVLIGLVIICSQTIKAALSNPTTSLKYE